MTDIEQLILTELAAIREECGETAESMAKVEVYIATHEDRLTKLEGFKSKLLMAVVGSGLVGAGSGTLAQLLGF